MPLEIQCKQEAALLIQQLPKTWLLCLPLRLAHTLLPHSTPHSIHSYTTYNTIRHTRREENKLQAKIEESQLWLGFAESLSHYSLCITSHVFIWRPSSVFPPPPFFALEGQAGMWVINGPFMVSIAASELQFDQSRRNAAEDLSWHLGLFLIHLLWMQRLILSKDEESCWTGFIYFFYLSPSPR